MMNQKEKIIFLVLKRERLRSELSETDKELDAALMLNEKLPPNKELVPDRELPPSFTVPQIVPTRNETKQPLSKGEFMPGSVPDQIIKILNAQPDRTFSAEDLTDEEAGRSNQNVRNSLFRMEKNGQILRPERGRYQAVKEKK